MNFTAKLISFIDKTIGKSYRYRIFLAFFFVAIPLVYINEIFLLIFAEKYNNKKV
jgi:hypothetical protein